MRFVRKISQRNRASEDICEFTRVSEFFILFDFDSGDDDGGQTIEAFSPQAGNIDKDLVSNNCRVGHIFNFFDEIPVLDSSHIVILHPQISGEKPYKCNVCDRSFTESSSRRKHMFTHFPERKLEAFSCEICGKFIKSKDSFKRHMENHTGQKNFECPICSRPFARESLLRAHAVIHTGECFIEL